MAGDGGGIRLGDLTQETLPLVVLQLDSRVCALEKKWSEFIDDWKEEKRWRRNSLWQTGLTILGWGLTIYLALRR